MTCPGTNTRHPGRMVRGDPTDAVLRTRSPEIHALQCARSGLRPRSIEPSSDRQDPDTPQNSPRRAGQYGIALAARQGRGLEARVLRGKDPSCRWTHLGLAFVHAQSGVWHVVHADPAQGHDGCVREHTFAQFAAQGLDARIMPLRAVDLEIASRLRREALRHLGVPFDGSYDWTRADAMYCTSFLWRLFTAVGIPAPQPPFPSFVLPMLGARELILPSLIARHTGDLWD